MKKSSHNTPESTLALITPIAEQLSELLAQAEVLATDAITHIRVAQRTASKTVPYDQPTCVARTYRQIGLNNQLKKLTIAGLTNNLSLMEKNIAYLAAQINSYKQKDHLSRSQTDRARRLLSEEVGRLSLISLKGHKQLKGLASKIKDTALSIGEIPLPEKTKLYFKGIEASTRRLALISDSMASNVDWMLLQDDHLQRYRQKTDTT